MHEPQNVDRVPLACIPCRNRHVKCDTTEPPCSRCKRDGKECTYQASRRGGLDRAALARRRIRLQQEAEAAQQNQFTPSQHANAGFEVQLENIFQADQPAQLAHQLSGDRLLDLYYANFWPSFPITLPYHFLKDRLQNNRGHGLGTLLPVLHWIGSIYASWTPSETYYASASQALLQAAATPFNVQALMLLALAQHHCNKREEARKTLNIAIAMSLQLHMNQRDFARSYGEGNPVVEESWRRTYYFLYKIDQEFSIVARSLIFATANIPITVDLPCDDEAYESGVSIVLRLDCTRTLLIGLANSDTIDVGGL